MLNKLVLYLLLIFSASRLTAQDIPAKPEQPRMVNDFAGIFGEAANALEAKLRAYNDSTSTQVVVVSVSSLNGYYEADFAYRLAELWGIGQKGKNNGLLILVAPRERATRIEVGYGLEAFLPDAKVKWIISNKMLPAFKQGNYALGVNNAVDEIIDKASGAYLRDGSESDTKTKKMPWGIIIIVVIFVLFSIFRNKNGGSSGYRSSGPFYGGGGFGGGFGGGSGGGFGGFGGGGFGGGGAGGRW